MAGCTYIVNMCVNIGQGVLKAASFVIVFSQMHGAMSTNFPLLYKLLLPFVMQRTARKPCFLNKGYYGLGRGLRASENMVLGNSTQSGS